MKVKCITPHGGCHNGMQHNGLPVHRLADGTLPTDEEHQGKPHYIDPATLRLPAHEGGHIEVPALGRYVAFGEVIDWPDDLPLNEFHFELIDGPPAPPVNDPPAGAGAGE